MAPKRGPALLLLGTGLIGGGATVSTTAEAVATAGPK